MADHTWTSNIINPFDWLPCRCATLPLVGCPHYHGSCMSSISPSCWGTHFLHLSNPPSRNFLPIIPCFLRWLILLDLFRSHFSSPHSSNENQFHGREGKRKHGTMSWPRYFIILQKNISISRWHNICCCTAHTLLSTCYSEHYGLLQQIMALI